MLKKFVVGMLTVIISIMMSSRHHTAGHAEASAQNFTGQAAVNFLKESGIYNQLTPEVASGFSPDGREFFFTELIGASDGATDDLFGIAVTRDGDTVLIGVSQADINGTVDQGAAYIFSDADSIGWVQQAKLTADDGTTNDHFGFSVALEGDTVLVGAPQADINGSSDQGATYVFKHNGVSWNQTAKLVAANGAAGDEFGTAVALDGSTSLVGAPLGDINGNADQGAVYVYTQEDINWNESAVLTAEFGAAGDEFGSAVALDGNTALVGAPFKDMILKEDRGAAYVFTGSGDSWSQETRLLASDGAEDDRFGGAVALDGNTVLVGAHLADINDNNNQGAEYIFIRDGGSWSQQEKLTNDGGAAGDRLGRSVAVEGDTALLGAPRVDVFGTTDQGAAYVFIRQGDNWSLQSRLTDWTSGDAGDRFGRSVALDGDTALVGSLNAGDSNQGAVYAFARSNMPWVPVSEAVTEDGAEDDEFGYAVALDGERALVGALAAAGNEAEDAGAAYIFERSADGWVQVDKLVADDGQDNDDFGYSVALDGDTALVGAPRSDVYGSESRGVAYIFTRNGNSWSQQAQLAATTGSTNDLFGSSVALDGDTALVGAPKANPPGYDEQGAAYIFKREGGNWPQRSFLIAADGEGGDGFGTAVAFLGDTALVGAPNAEVDGAPFQGAAYVFTLEGTVWSQQAKLTAADGNKLDGFGQAVALNGSLAVIGAYSKEAVSGSDYQGAIYVFNRSGNSWSQQARLTATDGVEGDYFGYSVSLENNNILVGAPGADIYGIENRGAVYLFVRDGDGWHQQTKLTAGNGAENDVFGAAVALSGTTILVGTSVVEVNGNSYQGKIYFFQRPPYEIFLPAIVR